MKDYNARWYHRIGIWFGIGLNPASITMGGGLAAALPFQTLFWVVPVGCLLLMALAIAAGIIGQSLRAPLARWSVSTFGFGIGALTINLMMGVGMVGWHGFQLGLAGTALGVLLRLPNWLGIVLLAVTVCIASFSSVNRWNWLTWITGLSALGLAIFSLLAVGTGIDSGYQTPQTTFRTILWAIGTIASFAALFALRVPDFTFDLKTRQDVVIDGLALFVALIFGVLVGMYLYRATGSWDLTVILAGSRIAFVAQLFLVLSLIAPTLSSVHSGALAWSNVLPITSRVGIVLLIGLGLVLGLTRFDQRLLPFLDWIGTIVPPALAVMIGAVFVRRYTTTKWTYAAWVVGALIALGLKIAGQDVHFFAGFIISLLVLFSARIFNPRAKLAPS